MEAVESVRVELLRSLGKVSAELGALDGSNAKVIAKMVAKGE